MKPGHCVQFKTILLADLAERNSHLDRIVETPPRRESHIH
jgi:hypothetical protein